MCCDPVTISSAGDVFQPHVVLEVLKRMVLRIPLSKVSRGFQLQLLLDLARIYRA